MAMVVIGLIAPRTDPLIMKKDCICNVEVCYSPN